MAVVVGVVVVFTYEFLPSLDPLGSDVAPKEADF